MHSFTSKIKHSYTGTATTLDVLKVFWRGARLYKLSLTLMVVGVVAARLVDIAVPLFYKRFFDTLNSVAAVSDKVPLLLHIIWMILGFNLLLWVGYRTMNFCSDYFESKLAAKLKQQAFEYMIDHSYAFYANHFTGSLVQRVNRFSDASRRLTERCIGTIIPLFIQITGVAVVLWFTNPVISAVLVIWVFFFLLCSYFFARWRLKYDIRRAEMDSFTTGVLADAMTNHNTIQLFTGRQAESEYFRKVTTAQARAVRIPWNLGSAMDAVQSLLIFLIEFLLFYFAIHYWQQGIVTIGTFVLIQVYLVGLGARLWDFGRVIRDIYECFADAKEMVDILKLPHDITDAKDAPSLTVQKGEVIFRSVNFNFSEKRSVLHDLDMTITSGEKVALIGPSGAGKSTFVKLLLRLYDVSSGSITIDGTDIRSVTQESVRRNVSLVPQDPILFHRTLLENIRYGRRGASDAEALEAARLAHCDEFALALPAGYGTYVGERGIKLSGGERQRVAIARAILKNAPILVLDEATSSLDSHSESLIQDALNNLMKGKTVIVIAHRLSTIRKMDRIIVLEKGRVIEEGGHDALLREDGSLYRKLWNLQAGGFIQAT